VELEQRVKALEYEVKILKNEIQKILLEIQEQILVHYYPPLRSEPPARAERPAPALEIERVQPPAPPADPGLPVVKRVSLEEIRATHVTPAAASKPSELVAASQAAESVNLNKLVEWGLHTTAQIGSERTTQLVGVCAQRGLLTPEMKELLLQIVPLNRRAAPEQVPLLDVIRAVLKLEAVLGREGDTEEALAIVEEAQLG
jgi:hypothetical protein